MTTTTDTPTLADRIRAAESAAAPARQRVGALQAAITRAVSTGEYAQAAETQEHLSAAREELAAADAAIASLRASHAEIERQRTAETQAITEARQRASAEQALEAARADEALRRGQVSGALEAMWAAVAEAQRQLRAAVAFEEGVNLARHAQLTARGQLGEWPANDPGPTLARSNTAAALVERDELVRSLAAWSR